MRKPALEVFHTDKNKVQRVYSFPNGYGASMVRVKTAQHWELVVIRFYGPKIEQFEIDDTNPVLETYPSKKKGYIDEIPDHDLEKVLTQIEQLPPPLRIVHIPGKTLN